MQRRHRFWSLSTLWSLKLRHRFALGMCKRKSVTASIFCRYLVGDTASNTTSCQSEPFPNCHCPRPHVPAMTPSRWLVRCLQLPFFSTGLGRLSGGGALATATPAPGGPARGGLGGNLGASCAAGRGGVTAWRRRVRFRGVGIWPARPRPRPRSSATPAFLGDARVPPSWCQGGERRGSLPVSVLH